MKIKSHCKAVQLVGPDQLELNESKAVLEPEPNQILCRVKVVGLCFSDMKLLKQFSAHVRKGPVEQGVDQGILDDLPSYVPGATPTVPGHETVLEIAAVGSEVRAYAPGERYVVQADWRWLKTRESNGAFGYNFEGGLQEYVLLDQRLIESPEGERMFMPIARDDISLSALALVEPWACVEQSYQSRERVEILADGRLLIIDDGDHDIGEDFLGGCPAPREIVRIAGSDLGGRIDELATGFDDIIYLGSDAANFELACRCAAKGALIIAALCGGEFERQVETPLGDIHYRGIRIAGTPGSDPAAGYDAIPATSEIRSGDRIHVVGAGGPMGVMHVMRNLCQGIAGIQLVAADLSAERLAALAVLAESAASDNGLVYSAYIPGKQNPPCDTFDYTAIMAPVPALCAEAVRLSAPNGIINIFAGIPAGQGGPVDLNKYIKNRLYFVGTSGSVMEDMQIVKDKVEAGRLDTNVSVAAISGLEGAIQGLEAVRDQSIAGKILVYPECPGLGLIRLDQLADIYPQVAEKISNGVWTKAAEEELLKPFQKL